MLCFASVLRRSQNLPNCIGPLRHRSTHLNERGIEAEGHAVHGGAADDLGVLGRLAGLRVGLGVGALIEDDGQRMTVKRLN